MGVGKGKFLLYSKIDPPLTAGTYRFTAKQVLGAEGMDEDDLRVEQLETHVRVRSPLYVLPPDQVLSTFPPAGREGAFGARLPQIVIKRRTLPWERDLDPIDMAQVDPEAELDDAPWLALVVVAQGEAELKPNQPIDQCVTPGVTIPGLADAEVGNALHIRKSMVDRIFPTQQEVHLLAHARQVDLDDTELMMGDDDGFLSVVIANRLPLPGRGDDGEDVPVKYLACLVNLCGQFHSLPPKAPTPPADVLVTTFPLVQLATEVTVATQDKLVMGTLPPQALDVLPKADVSGTVIRTNVVNPQAKAAYEAQPGWGATSASRGTKDLYVEMARDFGRGGAVSLDPDRIIAALDPVLRFPVLIHWSFTSFGDETFESLMKGLDSGLLGTRGAPNPDKPKENPESSPGRLPLEVVETGHVGLPHRLRRGDEVRSWYRGPLLPHPADEAADRLPLAHAADQIRVVVPDGREDVSLAAAFEIGRLLGLSRPSMVAALMRWRQLGFQQARLAGVVGSGILDGLADVIGDVDRFLGGRLGAAVAEHIVASPEDILGNPAPLVTAGVPVLDEAPNKVLARGLGLPAAAFEGEPGLVLEKLRGAEVKLPGLDLQVQPGLLKDALAATLDARFSRASIAALAPTLTEDVLTDVSGVPLDLGLALGGLDLGPAVLGGLAPGPIESGAFQPHGKGVDALDGLIEEQDRLADEADDEGGA
ncbi:hypothetical protein GON03_23215 [Nocardioides sp. MAH-18]|uniref:Uncharacterized protein n=1 Tax=Nocardioides agri TaxID=2682843 RepID=A0A6L6XZF6_9ACTN|nr:MULTISPECIES: hypothetical protein [unclassified Nocardioides]MBA2952941.1 hypothetical protein [Nocardioides sp. CGMCC 1.13656]MVQ52103.1 hypothetical protein [Nocardioides sp. MAH-18]